MIPAPDALKLPFATWRPGQAEAVREVLAEWHAGTSTVILEAPTGCGKSAIAMSAAKMRSTRTYIVVATKQLQEQYLRDFPWLRTVKGRGNFPCPWSENRVTAEHCHYEAMLADAKKCPLYSSCPYFVQRDAAMASPFVVFNYPYFLRTVGMNMEKWPPADVLVLDEAHTAEDHLMDLIAPRFLETDFLDHGCEFPAAKDEAFECLVSLQNVVAMQVANLDAKTNTARGGGDLIFNVKYFEYLKQLKSEKELQSKLRAVISEETADWLTILGKRRDGVRFVELKPLWVAGFADAKYFAHGQHHLLMSATICDAPVFARSLGILHHGYVTMPSSFPVDRRPFVLDYVGNMSMKYVDETMPKLLERIANHVAATSEKGIVHAVNYDIATTVADYLRSLDLPVFTHEGAQTREDVLDAFRAAPRGALVSPSFEIGVDLPYENVRWQFIAKVPYPSLGDEVTKRRADVDRRWYSAKTLQRVVQAYGRAMRAADDWGITTCLDSEWGHFWPRVRDFAPRWFAEAIRPKGVQPLDAYAAAPGPVDVA